MKYEYVQELHISVSICKEKLCFDVQVVKLIFTLQAYEVHLVRAV